MPHSHLPRAKKELVPRQLQLGVSAAEQSGYGSKFQRTPSSDHHVIRISGSSGSSLPPPSSASSAISSTLADSAAGARTRRLRLRRPGGGGGGGRPPSTKRWRPARPRMSKPSTAITKMLTVNVRMLCDTNISVHAKFMSPTPFAARCPSCSATLMPLASKSPMVVPEMVPPALCRLAGGVADALIT